MNKTNITIVLLAAVGIFLYFFAKQPTKPEYFNTITPVANSMTEKIEIEYESSEINSSKAAVSSDKNQTINPDVNEMAVKVVRENGELYAVDADGNEMAVPLVPESKEIYAVNADGNEKAVLLVPESEKIYAVDLDGNETAVPLAPESEEIYAVDPDGNEMVVPLAPER